MIFCLLFTVTSRLRGYSSSLEDAGITSCLCPVIEFLILPASLCKIIEHLEPLVNSLHHVKKLIT